MNLSSDADSMIDTILEKLGLFYTVLPNIYKFPLMELPENESDSLQAEISKFWVSAGF